jgi:hypothetical protein
MTVPHWRQMAAPNVELRHHTFSPELPEWRNFLEAFAHLEQIQMSLKAPKIQTLP